MAPQPQASVYRPSSTAATTVSGGGWQQPTAYTYPQHQASAYSYSQVAFTSLYQVTLSNSVAPPPIAINSLSDWPVWRGRILTAAADSLPDTPNNLHSSSPAAYSIRRGLTTAVSLHSLPRAALRCSVLYGQLSRFSLLSDFGDDGSDTLRARAAACAAVTRPYSSQGTITRTFPYPSRLVPIFSLLDSWHPDSSLWMS